MPSCAAMDCSACNCNCDCKVTEYVHLDSEERAKYLSQINKLKIYQDRLIQVNKEEKTNFDKKISELQKELEQQKKLNKELQQKLHLVKEESEPLEEDNTEYSLE